MKSFNTSLQQNYISFFQDLNSFILNESFFDFQLYDIPRKVKPDINGDNSDTLAIILKKEDFKAQELLITKILAAINFDIKTHVCVILFNDGETIDIAKCVLPEINKVVCFGIKPAEISFNASFRANTFYQTETFGLMLTHSLSILSTDNSKKKALWTALQETFPKS